MFSLISVNASLQLVEHVVALVVVVCAVAAVPEAARAVAVVPVAADKKKLSLESIPLYSHAVPTQTFFIAVGWSFDSFVVFDLGCVARSREEPI
jgi:hypothetical protein